MAPAVIRISGATTLSGTFLEDDVIDGVGPDGDERVGGKLGQL
jgi:hypothetical protein